MSYLGTEACGTIRVSNLPLDITSFKLFQFFKNFGGLDENSIKVKTDLTSKIAYVTFDDSQIATDIVHLHLQHLLEFPGSPDLVIERLLPFGSQSEASGSVSSGFNSWSYLGERDDEDDSASVASSRMSMNITSSKDNNFLRISERPLAGNCSIFVNNVTIDSKPELKALFAKYGALKQPHDVVLHRRGTTDSYFAFINFVSQNSARCALEDKNNIFWRKMKLDVRPSDSKRDINVKKFHPIDGSCHRLHEVTSSGVSTDSNKIDAYPKVLVTELPKDVKRIEIFNVFRRFGTIPEPPGIDLEYGKGRAVIPFYSPKSVNDAIRNTNGFVVLRKGKHVAKVCAFDAEINFPTFPPRAFNELPLRSVKKMPLSKTAQEKRKSQVLISVESRVNVNEIQTTNKENLPPIGNEESPFLQIRNINNLKSPPADLLQKYFRNEKRSGGGPLSEFQVEEHCDRVLVKFQDPAASERILKNTNGHQLEEVSLYVSKLPPVCRKRVFLYNIPDWINKSYLDSYIGSRALCETVSIMFRCDNTRAMVEFVEEPDIEKLKAKLKEKPLQRYENEQQEESVLEVFPVHETDCVIVHGKIPSKDAMSLALEDFLITAADNQSLNCSVRYIINYRNDEFHQVIFEDYRCVSLLNDHIDINTVKYNISKFYDQLGLVMSKDKTNFQRTYADAKFLLALTDLQLKYLRIESNLERCRLLPSLNKWTFYLAVNRDQKTLQITATNKQLSEKIANAVKTMLVPANLTLDESMMTLFTGKSSIFDDEMKRFFEDDIVYELVGKTLSIISSQSQKIDDVLAGFFDAHVTYTEPLNRTALEYHYLKRHYQEIFQKDLKCNIKWSDQEQVVLATGYRMALTSVREQVDELLKDNKTCRLNFIKRGVPTYFRGPSGFNEKKCIEDHTRTVIMDENSLDDLNRIFSVNTAIKGCRLDGTYNSTLKILVICCDMTEQKVDCIVNASNNELHHGGGLAGALSSKAGQSMQKECFDYVKQSGNVKTGDVFASGPGNLDCRHIIHAVGPRYKNGLSKEDVLLRNAVTNSVKKANELNCKSIAIPAISTNIFGYPVDQAIPIIIDACISYSHVSLSEIRFVDLKLPTVDLFVDNLKKLPNFKLNVNLPNEKNDISSGKTSINNAGVSVYPDVIILNSCEDSSRTLMVNDCKIEFIKDSIVNVAGDFDIIVNTTGTDIFGGSACCKAIVAAAGQALVDDAAAKYPNGMETNDVAVTVAGQIPCKNIFHVACSKWHAATSPGQLKTKITACLDEAEKLQRISIAFPAIGTGGLGFPADTTSKLMFDYIEQWLRAKTRSCIQKIGLVLYPGDTKNLSPFETEYNARLNKGSTSYSGAASNTVSIGHLIVELVKGDITREETDAIVCPSNKTLDLNQGQVAKALLAASGASLTRLVKASDKNFDNGVFILDVGNILSAPNVIFVDVPSSGEDSQWFDIFIEILRQANDNALQDISMPLLGAGTLNKNVEEVVDLMFQVFRKFAFNVGAKSELKTIRIILHDDANFQLVCLYVSKLLKSGKNLTLAESKGRLTAFKEIVKKTLSFFNGGSSNEYESGTALATQFAREDPLTFIIYGTQQATQEAGDQLLKLCDEKWPEKTILDDVIERLSNAEVELLHVEAKKFGVELIISTSQRKIKLRGMNVDDFAGLVRKILSHLSDNMETVEDIKWYKKLTGTKTWLPVEGGVGLLEKAFRSKNVKTINYPVPFEDVEGATVDFKSMIIRKNEKVVCELRRKRNDDDIPLEWEWNERDAKDVQYNLVQLDATSKEFLDVRSAAFATAPNTPILKIERLENPVKYRQYTALKRQMKDTTAAGVVFERTLFHGTAATSIPSICVSAFDRSFAGAHATMYGHGSYFARDFKYSLGYGKTIFYCHVLTGAYCQGGPEIKAAPSLDATRGLRYDSVVDNVAAPTIFVVFSDNHAYPAYLITCA